MSRKAQSYSCPFCTYTGEKKEAAQKHMKRHLKKILQYKKVIKDLHIEAKGNAGFHADGHTEINIPLGLYTVYLVEQ